MNVLVACECSGTVRDAFIAQGHTAISCDLEPTDIPGPHLQQDVRTVDLAPYDLIIAHPPCTYLACSGARYWASRQEEQNLALQFVQWCMDIPVASVAIENPVGRISTAIRKPDQIIHPWQFGDEAEKTTCLWLKNLPLLVPTNIVGKGEIVIYKSGVRMSKWYADFWHLPPTLRRKSRSKTFPGIASAMAKQWGGLS